MNFPHRGVGLSLQSSNYASALKHSEGADFFELISENFMQTGGYPLHVLDRLVERGPVFLHGISLSIAGPDPLDVDYLTRLKALARRARVSFVSDHLCWTSMGGRHTHDLLPVPLTEEAFEHVKGRVLMVQDALDLPLVLENASSYLEFTSSTITEWDFLARLAEECDCGLLLDINNIYVSAFNHGYDPYAYIDAIAPDRIVYQHLAGHTNRKSYLKDTHGDHVSDAVWELFEYCEARTGGRSTVIEWDINTPTYAVLLAELQKVRDHAVRAKKGARARPAPVLAKTDVGRHVDEASGRLFALQASMYDSIVNPSPGERPLEWVRSSPRLDASRRMDIYRSQYRYRMVSEMKLYFPACERLLGSEAFAAMVASYVQFMPPSSYNIFRMRDRFPEFLRGQQSGPLYDVSRVERAFRDVYDAPIEMTQSRSLLSPAVQLLKLSYDVLPFWKRAEDEVADVPTANWALAYRRGYKPDVIPIGQKMFRVLRLLQRGVPLDRAVLRVAGPRLAPTLQGAVEATGLLCRSMSNRA